MTTTNDRKYDGATCRGSLALGTACGHCERCEDERRRLMLSADETDIRAQEHVEGR